MNLFNEFLLAVGDNPSSNGETHANLFNKFQSLMGMISGDKSFHEKVEFYGRRIAKAITDLRRYYIQEEGRKWFTMITSGPVDDPDRVLKVCHGDSGGPLVKQVKNIHGQKRYVHMGVSSIFEVFGGFLSDMPESENEVLYRKRKKTKTHSLLSRNTLHKYICSLRLDCSCESFY
ncbi:MAG: hypothetical protein OXC40_04815 [Proteobacteria bacterium]|nr:hypothetical protein [Pseudomonadota bacterium]